MILCDPLGYLDFLRLQSEARLVLTDSGGIQEETTVLGVPCLTVRRNTERPITIAEGTNRLIGTDPEAIVPAVDELLAGPPCREAGAGPLGRRCGGKGSGCVGTRPGRVFKGLECRDLYAATPTSPTSRGTNFKRLLKRRSHSL